MKTLLIALLLSASVSAPAFAGSVTGGFGKAKTVEYCGQNEDGSWSTQVGLWRDHRNDEDADQCE